MATLNTTAEDIKFFEFLYPYVWPNATTERLAWAQEDLRRGLLSIETMVEEAMSHVGGYRRDSVHGKDHEDGSDSKKVTSCFRNNNIKDGRWTNSYIVSRTKSKVGMLRILAYNRAQDKFDFYAIPKKYYGNAEKVEIVLETWCYCYERPEPRGRDHKNRKWFEFKLDSWEELCKISEEDMIKKVEKKHRPFPRRNVKS